MLSFLDSLPLEFPEEFPEYWKNGSSIRNQRVLLNEAEETHLAVSLQGLTGVSVSDDFANPYDRVETVGAADVAE